jgi:hypothetical protein
MRTLSKFEHDIAIAIIIKNLEDWECFHFLDDITNMEWSEASFSKTTDTLMDRLYTFLEIPEENVPENQEDWQKDWDKTNYYCRDWLAELECALKDKMKDEKLSKEYIADQMLALLILGNSDWKKYCEYIEKEKLY